VVLPFDELILINLSVWESWEDLKSFVYRTHHSEIMRQREHFWHRGDQRHAPGRGHGISRHRTLNSKEVCTPVAEREDESETHDQPKPVDSKLIVSESR
jgi:hypothetical protein